MSCLSSDCGCMGRCGANCNCGSECLCRCSASDVLESWTRGQDPSIRSTGDAPTAGPTTTTTTSIVLASAHHRNNRRTEVEIDGMTCSMCAQAIENALKALEFVHTVAVNLTTDSAVVTWFDGDDENDESEQTLVNTIQAIGYDVVNVNTTSTLTTDSAVGTNLADVESSQSSQSQFQNMQARWDRLQERQQLKVQQRWIAFCVASFFSLPVLIITMILPHLFPNASYILESTIITVFGKWKIPLQSLILWIFATLTQTICGYEFYRGTWFAIKSKRAGMDVLVCLGTSASYLYALYGIVTEAHSSTIPDSNDHPHGHDEDTTHFFETATTLITFVLAGKWMQAAAVNRTSSALARLLALQTKTAIKITPVSIKDRQNFNPLQDPYEESTVPIEDIKEGDLVKILPGSAVPADGKIAFGQVSIDESMLTGESMPVFKNEESVVLGGTVCVESSSDDTEYTSDLENASEMPSTRTGAAFVQVTGVGSATALSQIIQLVTDAQTASASSPMQNLADSISAVFVPSVVIMSTLTTAVWYLLCQARIVPVEWYESSNESAVTFSLLFGIAVLVISCPCALGLATPTAIMVGTGVGAKLGILIKSGQAVETAAKVTTVIFDKTGTLTKGTPTITDFFQLDQPGELVLHGKCVGTTSESTDTLRGYYLWLLASLERSSTHPLAKAVVAYANDNKVTVHHPLVQPTSFHALTGRGASALVEGIPVSVGNRAFALALNLSIPQSVDECMKSLEDDGKTAILAAINGKVCFVMGVADQIKDDAATSIAFLQEHMRLNVWMITGDNGRTANAVAQRLGILSGHVIAEALPSTKAEHVRRFQHEESGVVCFVGDGINDAPALAVADLGLAIGTGTDIAAEASDIVLVSGNVSDVCTALHLSRSIFRRIQWNLVLSLVYNCLGIPIAAGLIYPMTHLRLPPPLAALAMALSSISVVLSSIALRFYNSPCSTDARHCYFCSPLSSLSTSLTLEGWWIRHQPFRLFNFSRTLNEDSDIGGRGSDSLLENDHLISASSVDATETTRCTDNRTTRRRV